MRQPRYLTEGDLICSEAKPECCSHRHIMVRECFVVRETWEMEMR